MKFHRASFVVAVAAALLAVQVQAADIYQWTDDSGRVHMGDSVPDRYRSVAKVIDSAQFRTSEAARKEATARAERDKLRANAVVANQPRARTQAPPRSQAQASQPVGAIKATEDAGAECAAQQRLFRASQECFAPFVNVNGSVKPEAHSVCRVVTDPTTRCGPPDKP